MSGAAIEGDNERPKCLHVKLDWPGRGTGCFEVSACDTRGFAVQCMNLVQVWGGGGGP